MSKSIFNSIFFFFIVIILLTYFGFILNISISPLYTLLGLIIMFLYNYKNIKNIFSLIFIFIFCFILNTILMDTSSDGMGYHQNAIIFLSNGWNPIYQDLQDLNLNKFIDGNQIWTIHYVKLGEILSSNIIVFLKFIGLGNLESGKAVNYLLAFKMLFFINSILKNFFYKSSFIISIITIFNPVVLAQINTYNVDLLIYFFTIGIFVSLINLELLKQNAKKFDYILVIFFVVANSNVKLTGLAFSFIICLFYCLFVFLKNKKTALKKILIVGIGSTFFIFITGINPYLTNVYSGKNIIFPFSSKDLSFLTTTIPSEFLNQDRFTNMLYGFFGKTMNLNNSKLDSRIPELKIPFTWHNDEDNINVVDMRIGGFGHLFSGSLALSLLMYFFIFIRYFISKKEMEIKFEERNNTLKKIILYFLFLSITCLFSFIFIPYSFWARFIPQAFLIPIFAGILGLFLESKVTKIISVGIFATLAINMINPFIYSFGRSIYVSYFKSNLIASAKQYSEDHKLVIFADNANGESSFLYKLDEAKVNYTLIDSKKELTNLNLSLDPIPFLSKDKLKWNLVVDYNKCYDKDYMKSLSLKNLFNIAIVCLIKK